MQVLLGDFYELPAGLSWVQVAQARKRWDIPANFAPLALAPGVCAWGTLLPSNYINAQKDHR